MGKRSSEKFRSWLLSEWHKDPTCDYCGEKTKKPQRDIENSRDYATATIDHIVPKSKKGANRPFNFALSCYKCNHTKADNTWEPIKKRYAWWYSNNSGKKLIPVNDFLNNFISDEEAEEYITDEEVIEKIGIHNKHREELQDIILFYKKVFFMKRLNS